MAPSAAPMAARVATLPMTFLAAFNIPAVLLRPFFDEVRLPLAEARPVLLLPALVFLAEDLLALAVPERRLVPAFADLVVAIDSPCCMGRFATLTKLRRSWPSLLARSAR